MTGLMWDIGVTKQLEVLKEAVPKLSRIAVLRDPTGGWGPDHWREAEVASAARGLTLVSVEIRRQEDLEPAIQKLSQEHFDAILMGDRWTRSSKARSRLTSLSSNPRSSSW